MTKFQCLFLAFALAFSSSAMAAKCNGKKAVKEYYQGGDESTMVFVGGPYDGLYHIITHEADGAKCEGARATVDQNCNVTVVTAAFCSYE